MNLTKKIILALGTLTAVAMCNAQSSAAASAPAGVLGQEYTELSFGVQDIQKTSVNSYSLGAAQNKPLTANIDLNGSYSYGWLDGSGRGHSNVIGATATGYTKWNGVKPFAGLGLGYQWISARGFRDNNAIWGAAVGVEIPVGEFSITPSIRYSDDFRSARRSSQDVTYSTEVSTWVSKDLSVFGGIGYTDTRKSPFDSWNYTVGLRIKL